MEVIKPRLHERHFACDDDAIFFFKLSRRQPAAKMACVATLAQVMREVKISQKKNRENFNELNFLRQNHGLCQNLSPSEATTARW